MSDPGETTKPTSTAQFDAYKRGEVAGLEQVRDDVWALAVSMPGGHIPSSFTYLLRDNGGGIHVVDPGWDSDDNWARLTSALSTLDITVAGVTSITVTHLHADHLGMADRLRKASGSTLMMHERELRALDVMARPLSDLHELVVQWGVPQDRALELMELRSVPSSAPALDVDRVLHDGEYLPIDGFQLRVLATPGHTPGHICLVDNDRNIVLTGDHVLPTMFGGLGLGGPTDSNALADYLASCDRIARYADHEALPGHGYRFTGLTERASVSAAHHLRRTHQVDAALRERPDISTWELASALTWTAGWENLKRFYMYSALLQTSMHRNYLAN